MGKAKYVEELKEKPNVEKEAVNAANVEGEKVEAIYTGEKHCKSVREEVGAGT